MSIETIDTVVADEFGKCCACHKDLLTSKFYENSWHQTFSNDYDFMDFTMNDGSVMKVTVCTDCKAKKTDTKKLMKSVLKGWETEIQKLRWSENQKKKYMDKYSKLEIVKEKGLEIKPKEIKGDSNGISN